MTGNESRPVLQRRSKAPVMREPDFQRLVLQLEQHGIATRHARRTASELQDHYEDLVGALTAEGTAGEEAQVQASRRLGAMDDVVAEMSARRELKTWAFRYPYLAVVFYPLACIAALPAMPVIAGIANAPVVARWGVSMLAAGLLTAALMLLLQVSILFG